MEFIKNISIFVVLMGLLVLVHELGHLIAAKIFKVYCAEFAIGMGPKVYSYQGKETKYSIRLLPLGGYVSMAGEHDGELTIFPEDLPKSRYLNGIAPIKRIIVLISGVIMNIFLGILLFSLVFSLYATPGHTSNVIASVTPDSPAAKAGLREDDEIIQVVVNGETYPVNKYEDLRLATTNNQNMIEYTIKRNGETLTYQITPIYMEQANAYQVGIGFEGVPGERINFFSAIGLAFSYSFQMIKLIFVALVQLFRGIGLNNMSGPIGIFKETSAVANYGPWALVQLTALLSINLGVFNILPIPALDGGRILFVLYEMITGKPANKRIESALIIGSFVLLLALIIFVSIQDIVKLV